MGQRPLGDKAELSVVCGSLGYATLDLRHHSRSQSPQSIDIAGRPRSRLIVHRAQRAEDLVVVVDEGNADVRLGSDLSSRREWFLLRIRDDKRLGLGDDILAKGSVQGIPAVRQGSDR